MAGLTPPDSCIIEVEEQTGTFPVMVTKIADGSEQEVHHVVVGIASGTRWIRAASPELIVGFITIAIFLPLTTCSGDSLADAQRAGMESGWGNQAGSCPNPGTVPPPVRFGAHRLRSLAILSHGHETHPSVHFGACSASPSPPPFLREVLRLPSSVQSAWPARSYSAQSWKSACSVLVEKAKFSRQPEARVCFSLWFCLWSAA